MWSRHYSFQVGIRFWRALIGELRCGMGLLALGLTGLEDVVPIVPGRTEAAKRWVQSDHLFGHGVTGGVGVKTAIDGQGLG
jgi:hypothetical protein